MTMGERIKGRRLELKIKGAVLARSIGVTRHVLYKYESGIVINMPIDVLLKLCSELKICPNELLGWDEYILENRDKAN